MQTAMSRSQRRPPLASTFLAMLDPATLRPAFTSVAFDPARSGEWLWRVYVGVDPDEFLKRVALDPKVPDEDGARHVLSRWLKASLPIVAPATTIPEFEQLLDRLVCYVETREEPAP